MAPPATITAADVALHNTETDCWVSYQGTVYDITQFLPKHKSYQALLVPLCGKTDEFTQAFEGKHGMSKIDVLKSESVRVGDLTP
jgi:cytochrome b involved in lipid metabolism